MVKRRKLRHQLSQSYLLRGVEISEKIFRVKHVIIGIWSSLIISVFYVKLNTSFTKQSLGYKIVIFVLLAKGVPNTYMPRDHFLRVCINLFNVKKKFDRPP